MGAIVWISLVGLNEVRIAHVSGNSRNTSAAMSRACQPRLVKRRGFWWVSSVGVSSTDMASPSAQPHADADDAEQPEDDGRGGGGDAGFEEREAHRVDVEVHGVGGAVGAALGEDRHVVEHPLAGHDEAEQAEH